MYCNCSYRREFKYVPYLLLQEGVQECTIFTPIGGSSGYLLLQEAV